MRKFTASFSLAVRTEVLAQLPSEGQHQLPTALTNLADAQRVNAEFWVDHGEELEKRFNAWAAR
ncbi:hypothetical protein PS627_01708 [Pseudomonas fluorescens]|nr:hypothetical protein PS627_01708 [Pseudomonas fluorescens]VVP88465.1 hypothetical protein PS910_02651 [Pseudomonas fluorescens]